VDTEKQRIKGIQLHQIKMELSLLPLREKVRMRVFTSNDLPRQFTLTPALSQRARELVGQQ